ncbi:DegT/DnrJ/EryC1/StrS family aminotransferase [Candidatus Falkowbacteria bacterium]|nr:DegT/DnrJ/EryC1/StrS family aminotransferase [Candidatus Falkowbacteria bacterium]
MFVKTTLNLLNEIFIRKRFFQTNIFSGTTSNREIRDALRAVFSKRLTIGPEIDVYERKFAEYLGVRKCFSFSTGRMALYAILKVLNIGPGDEVIIPAFTCVVVPNAIIYAGAKPIYCDIESERFGPEPKDLEAKISPRTRAVIAQHTFGVPCLIDEIIEIGKKYGIPVIEDCAHALGGKEKGRPVGTLGYASFFSTDHTKVISTGIGGLAVSNDAALTQKLEIIYNESKFLSSWQIRRQILTYAIFHCLTHPRVYWLSKSFLSLLVKTKIAMFITDYLKLTKPTAYPFPARLSNVHSQIGISQLDSLTENLADRKRIANEFENITEVNEKLFKNEELDCVWLRYPILVENRDDFIRDLEKYYDFGIWFTTVAGCRSSNFADIGYTVGSCPNAERITKQIVSIPTHSRVKPKHILLNALQRLNKTSRGTYIYERSR